MMKRACPHSGIRSKRCAQVWACVRRRARAIDVDLTMAEGVVGAIHDAVESVAIIAAGAWTIYTFGLHRVRKPIIRLAIEGRCGDHGSVKILHVTFTANNSGRTGVSQS